MERASPRSGETHFERGSGARAGFCGVGDDLP
ncbi:MAG: hypothetical protein RI932_524, partial [Pseudomonadota bacterium]